MIEFWTPSLDMNQPRDFAEAPVFTEGRCGFFAKVIDLS